MKGRCTNTYVPILMCASNMAWSVGHEQTTHGNMVIMVTSKTTFCLLQELRVSSCALVTYAYSFVGKVGVWRKLWE